MWAATNRTMRRMSSKAPLVDIVRVPRTASWSMEDLHRHPNQADVLTAESLQNLAELCHLYVPESKLPKLMSEVEAIIQCTRIIQVLHFEHRGIPHFRSCRKLRWMRMCTTCTPRASLVKLLHSATMSSPKATTPTKCLRMLP
ncbi:hypothetical protein H257_09377, partial [Aphanomyces astaci]